ncbi:Polyketide cyclase / dehydrase and lipid transport [Saccharopolyspora antimicrobica]|uniref:Polyketide cyclase / dehydrase and lipid transport n=1 Tax=Saccharopolyspora antimicrobica TaxID=455193 RepID=A0A1I4VYX9_9PSEU|nr:SRPBCC family protein [Saccharopolyspora antimicrobica]RKT87146.1 polyketide cyclase/dehydrase/lipid transport protein [Saccharopolyspora antimicrobica]SFN06365.1 Polyketide cyclase / dehydrase and lipid transport [Saccharopolyspora antimicrobica]
MASTSVSRMVPASPERTWQLIGGFGSLPDWLPYIPESTLRDGGRVRELKNPDGDVITERLVDFNEAERHYSYAIEQAPFPVTGYVSTIRVHPVAGQQDAAEVQWSGRFTPDGATDEEVVALFTDIYRNGLDALHDALG